jgi:hypothetical protein
MLKRNDKLKPRRKKKLELLKQKELRTQELLLKPQKPKDYRKLQLKLLMKLKSKLRKKLLPKQLVLQQMLHKLKLRPMPRKSRKKPMLPLLMKQN